MLEAAGAQVVIDALLEAGRAHWPGVGSFTFVAVTRPSQHGPLVHVFPTRDVEFVPEALCEPARTRVRDAGGTVHLVGLGTFRLSEGVLVFSAEKTLIGLIRAAPLLLAEARELERPPPPLKASPPRRTLAGPVPPTEGPPAARGTSWLQRLLGFTGLRRP